MTPSRSFSRTGADDQQRVLDRLLRVLAILGGTGALILASGSWWLAGKSLVPAQQAWEKQQAFIANASHELRAPLTLIRASAEVAQRDLPRRDVKWPLLADILSEIDHMSTLVDDLLLLSRLDTGRLRLDIHDIRLRLFSKSIGPRVVSPPNGRSALVCGRSVPDRTRRLARLPGDPDPGGTPCTTP
jgi:signal transduction histidine kinase